MKVVAQ